MISIRTFNMGKGAVLPLAAAMVIAAGATLTSASAAEPALANNLYAAIYAEQKCGAGDFSQAQWERLNSEIAKHWRINDEIGDVLTFMQETKGKVSEIRTQDGCFSPEMKQLREKFARDLRPAL